MKRERISEEYNVYEPEARIWPFVILSFLIPLFPFVSSIVLNGSVDADGVLFFAVSVLPLLFASVIVRTGEKPWLLLVSSAVIFASVLISWFFRRESGELFPLGVPFALASSPAVLPLSSYAFYAKRRHQPWAGAEILALFLSLVFAASAYRYGKSIAYAVCPMAAFLLSAMNLFVTRRSESSPWYVILLLSALTLSSLSIYPGTIEGLAGGEGFASLVSAVLRSFICGGSFWLTLSFFFVYAALAGKSSYLTLVDEKSEEDEEQEEPEASDQEEEEEPMRRSGYAYPPFSSFREEKEEKRERPERKSEAFDDKWYEFIQNGVADERDDRRAGTREDVRRREGYYPDGRYPEERPQQYDGRFGYTPGRGYPEDDRGRGYYRDDRNWRGGYPPPPPPPDYYDPYCDPYRRTPPPPPDDPYRGGRGR